MGQPNEAGSELRQAALAFRTRELAGVLAETYPDRTRRASAVFEAYAAKGYSRLLIPREQGGGGLTYRQAGVVYEALSYGPLAGVPAVLGTAHCIELIKSARNHSRRGGMLAEIAAGAFPLGFCFTEETAGSDIAGVACRARRTSDGFRIDGTKSVVINSGIARYFILMATSAPGRGRSGLTAFVVDAAAEGVTALPAYDADGFQEAVIGPVAFEGVRLAAEALVGREGSGYLLFMETLDKGRPLVAACCVGAAQYVLDRLVAYTKARVQFDRPLYGFQGISFPLAEFATRIAAARLLCRNALKRIDRGAPFTLEASMAKLFAAELLRDLSAFSREILGYRDLTDQWGLSRVARDAQLLMSIDGTANVQRMVIASQL